MAADSGRLARLTRLAGSAIAGTEIDSRVLSPRQRQALRLVAVGASPARIAEAMGVRAATVFAHLRIARRKLGARSSEQAVAIAIMSGELAI